MSEYRKSQKKQTFIEIELRKISMAIYTLVQDLTVLEAKLSAAINWRDKLKAEVEGLRSYHLNKLATTGMIDVGTSTQVVNTMSELKLKVDEATDNIARLDREVEAGKESLALLRQRENKYKEYASSLSVETLNMREALINAELQDQYLLGIKGRNNV